MQHTYIFCDDKTIHSLTELCCKQHQQAKNLGWIITHCSLSLFNLCWNWMKFLPRWSEEIDNCVYFTAVGLCAIVSMSGTPVNSMKCTSSPAGVNRNGQISFSSKAFWPSMMSRRWRPYVCFMSSRSIWMSGVISVVISFKASCFCSKSCNDSPTGTGGCQLIQP